MGSATIEIDGLTKRYGPVAAVDDLTFRVEPGAITGFLGRNGAGKTTTMRALLGLVRPTSGTATIGGLPYAALAEPVRTVGAVLEASNAHPGRSAADHLRVVAHAAALPVARVDEVLGAVDLADVAGGRVGGFSLGMRQRLAIATALLGDPSVLVLDEPTNGLDPGGVRWLRDLLRGLGAEGRTVLVSSHLLAEVAQTVDHVVIIERGRLVHAGSLDGIAGASDVVVRTPDADRLVAVLERRGLRTRRTAADRVVVASDPESVGRAVADAGVVVYEMATAGGSLEDTFLSLTEDDR